MYVPGAIGIVKAPDASVVPEIGDPLIVTKAPDTGIPSAAFVTEPVIDDEEAGVGVGVIVGVGVGVGVCVDVGVEVCVCVGVAVGVWDAVAVGVAVGV